MNTLVPHVPGPRSIPPGARRAAFVRVGGAMLALALALLAVVNPVLGIVATLAVLLAAACMSRPIVAVAAFTFAVFLDIVAADTGMSPIKITGSALIVMGLLSLALRSRVRPVQRDAAPGWMRAPVVVFGALLYLGVALSSQSWAVNAPHARDVGVRLLTEMLAFFAVGIFVTRVRDLRTVAIALVTGAVVSTLIGQLTGANEFGRFVGTFQDPNEYAAAMAAGVAMAYGLVRTARSRSTRTLYAVLTVPCIYGIVASQSRGGIVALIVVSVMFIVTARQRERLRLTGIALLAVCVATAVLVVTPMGRSVIDRVTSTDSSGRSDLWRVAVLEFRSAPLHGVGLGNFPVVSNRFVTRDVKHSDVIISNAPRTTHNSYLEILAELGVLGFGAFLMVAGGSVLASAAAVRRARRVRDTPLIDMSRAHLAALVGLLTSCMFLSNHYSELLWTLMATNVACAAMSRARVRDERADEDAPQDSHLATGSVRARAAGRELRRAG